MFYQPSPRWITPQAAAEIAAVLPPFVVKVGVFVDPTAEMVQQALATCRLDALQFHGEETPEFCRQFGRTTIKAFRIRDAQSLQALRRYDREAWLLDSYVPGQAGGTGTTFNWDLAAEAARVNPWIILAGGLTAENAGEAIRVVRPYALDVSSGVESSPGRKDPEKMRRFVTAVRSAAGPSHA